MHVLGHGFVESLLVFRDHIIQTLQLELAPLDITGLTSVEDLSNMADMVLNAVECCELQVCHLSLCVYCVQETKGEKKETD